MDDLIVDLSDGVSTSLMYFLFWATQYLTFLNCFTAHSSQSGGDPVKGEESPEGPTSSQVHRPKAGEHPGRPELCQEACV